MSTPIHSVKLDEEDVALLEAVIRYEKLTKSDVIRRAIRTYASQLGVTVQPSKRQSKTP